MTFHPQPLRFLAVGLVAGTLAPVPSASLPIFAALALAGFLAAVAIVRPKTIPLTALVVAAAAGGAALAANAREVYQKDLADAVTAGIEGSLVLEGRVSSDPRVVDEEMRFEVEATRLVAGGLGRSYRGRVRVFVRGPRPGPAADAARIRKGDVISAWVELRPPEPVRTPGGFDQFAWARREGLHAFATCKSERLLRITRRSERVRSLADRVRDRLKASWRHVPDPLDRAVTASMVLGDEGALDRTTRDEFRSAGLLHLLVVSGSQVAVLILGLRRLMPAGLRITWTGCDIEFAILFTYCVVAGAGDSILRATVMAMAFAVAVRVDLQRGSANFLFGAALVLLALRPLDALDPGAQMSFAATLALVTFAGRLSRSLETRRVPGLLADILSATLVASIAVLPLTLMNFHRFTLIAIPANMVAAPLAALLLYGSLVTTVLDVILPPLASIAGIGCGLTAEALRALAHHAAAADPDWRAPSPPLALMLGLSGLLAGSGWRRVVLPTSGLLATLTMSGLPAGDGRLHLWFLDVGQGDAIVIETPSGRAAVIDAGPAFEGFDAGERVVGEALFALGHRRLDFLGVTHRHADHQGGAAFLARHFDPARLYVNGESAALADFRTTTVVKRESWSLDGVVFRVLGPDPDWSGPGLDENARSLVIEVIHGSTSFLLTGDASIVSERWLDLPERGYDVVKVGHHGARTSSSPGFVRQVHARIAVVSVGARNRFSHPNAAVVERWRGSGALVWRTDLHRTLHVSSDGVRIFW